MHKKTLYFKRIKRSRGLIFLALPAFLYILIFYYVPLYGLILPFMQFDYSLGFLKSPWVGLENFKFLFSSQDIYRATFNTLGYNFIFIFLGTFLSVCVALMLFEMNKRATRIYQTVMFFPFFLSWAIIAYVALGLLDMQHGVLNQILGIFKIDPVLWYNDPKYWPFILVITSMWKGLGYSAVIYYAGLMGLDTEYYEAAKIDGASKFQQITRISIPLLSPLIVMMILLGIGRMLYSDFGLFYSVPLNSGLLTSSTEVIDTYVFKLLRSFGDINISAAANFYQSSLGFILMLSTNWIVKKYNSDLSVF